MSTVQTLTASRPRLRDGMLAVVLYGGLVVALLFVPRLVPSNPDLFSAAAADGYNTVAAYWVAAAWTMLVIVVATWAGWKEQTGPASLSPRTALYPVATAGHLNWRELLIVFALFALAFFPPFLSRYGPYIEDQYFLLALNRMNGGQVPYRDFAFLYGPLMLYPLWVWNQLIGFSMASFYGFLALVEGLQSLILMAVLQYFVPHRGRRYLTFLMLLPILWNTTLGLNYNAMRWLIPSLIVVLAAHRPPDRRTILWCAALLGIHLAYAHEYALAALAAISGMYVLAALRERQLTGVRPAAMLFMGSAIVWLVVVTAVLRSHVPSYIAHATDIVKMMSSGHAGFRFYWTVNSLALFGLLLIACLSIGKGWRPGPGRQLASGDRLLLGAVLFALVALRSGLTRADLWHLNPGFLPLMLAVLLRLPMNAFSLTPGQYRGAFALAATASVTMLVGNAPMGSRYAVGYVDGLIDTLTAVPRGTDDGTTRVRSIEFERTHPRADLVALGRYLAAPGRSHQPVLFYGRAWDISPRVGVRPEDYKMDDLLYTEFSQPDSNYLRKHKDALVVIQSPDYQRLYGLDPNTPRTSIELTPVKQLGRWLSTPHYDSLDTEARLLDETRDRLTGAYVRSNYVFAARFDEYVVLAPKAPGTLPYQLEHQ